MRILLLSALLILAACHSQRGIDGLNPEESAELNHYLTQRDDCLAQESGRLDDGRSDINALTDLVMWKCGPLSRQVDSLLYDKFKVDLSSSYAFKMQTEESGKKAVTEAILTNRKMRAGREAMDARVLQQPTPMVVPAVRASQQRQAPPVMVPEDATPIPASARPVQGW